MKLSTILMCQERIRELQNQQIYRSTWNQFFTHASEAIDDDLLKYSPVAHELQSRINGISSSLESLTATLELCLQDLKQEEQKLQPEYQRLSQEIYQSDILRTEKIVQDPLKSIKDFWQNQTPMSDDDIELIAGRLNSFNDWKIPGLIIRPGVEDWIDRLVALDPLYLADLDTALLRPALQRYPKLYQQRLRQYTIREDRSPMLDRLPKAQIGVVFCHDFFRMRTLDVMQKYISEIWDLLRPGGMFLFTYCDGDRSKTVELIERTSSCYTPRHQVLPMCIAQGFEILFEYASDLGWNYMELRRPGKISTLRGGQTLAKVRPIH
jgi:hypothetical protein